MHPNPAGNMSDSTEESTTILAASSLNSGEYCLRFLALGHILSGEDPIGSLVRKVRGTHTEVVYAITFVRR